MKKFVLFVLVSSICACNAISYAFEYKSVPTPKKLNDLVLSDYARTSYQSFLNNKIEESIRKEDKNLIYSPLSCFYINTIDSFLNNHGDLTFLKEFVENTNVYVNDYFHFDCLPCVATTKELGEDTIKSLNDNYVSVFTGNTSQLENSVSKLYGRRIKLNNRISNIISEINITASYYIPLTIVGKDTFEGATQSNPTYVSGIASGRYKETTDYLIFEIPVNSIKMRILMPKGDKKTCDFDFNLLNQQELDCEEVGIEYLMPKFSINQSCVLVDDNCPYIYQNNTFKFDEHGIKASSASIKGPTSPSDYKEITVKVNRPFIFSLNCYSVPLFYGEINSI